MAVSSWGFYPAAWFSGSAGAADDRGAVAGARPGACRPSLAEWGDRLTTPGKSAWAQSISVTRDTGVAASEW